jgi:hypothetical protein
MKSRSLQPNVSIHCTLDQIFNYHLFTETEGNSVFCGPETVDVSRGEAEGNIDGRGEKEKFC